MDCYLEGTTAPLEGKRLPITIDRPATIKTNKGADGVGEVIVAQVNGAIRLMNRSKIKCAINGTAASDTAILFAGDILTIGKQGFAVRVEASFCSVCDVEIDAVDVVKGWTDGNRYICRKCTNKGVRPGNLASVDPVAPEADALSTAPTSSVGDDHDETTEKVMPPSSAKNANANGESDSFRRQRRLSASRLAQVEQPEQKNGLFSKVGQVFSNREDRKRHDVLLDERRTLLEQAGRLALSENNGFGIPDHVYNPLLKGVAVSLRMQDFSIPAIERWRSIRQRLTVLDTEIGALRSSLGMRPDAMTLPPAPLRSDNEARKERAFEMMDGLATMELDGELGLDDEVAIPPPVSPGSKPKSAPLKAVADEGATASRSSGPARSVSGRRTSRRRR